MCADMTSTTLEEGYFMVSVPTAPPMVVTHHQQEQEALERPLPNAADAVPTVSDAFEEMVTVQPRDREGLEGKVLVVLDAANIGFEYGRGQGGGSSSNQGRSDRFDPSGIEAAINYFYNNFANAVVTAFIPAAMVRRRPNPQQGSSAHGQNALMQTDELDRLEHLVRSGVLIVVPAGDDDDAYAIAYARLHAGFLVSNDHYDSHARTLTCGSKRASLQAWLRDNRVGYTFAPGGAFMPNPGSALVASLRVADSSTTRLGALAGLPDPLVRALESLDAAAEALLACSQQGHGRASLLHVLMARVALRFDLGFAQECFKDCLACLALDPHNAAIEDFLQNKLGVSPPYST